MAAPQVNKGSNRKNYQRLILAYLEITTHSRISLALDISHEDLDGQGHHDLLESVGRQIIYSSASLSAYTHFSPAHSSIVDFLTRTSFHHAADAPALDMVASFGDPFADLLVVGAWPPPIAE